jgi:hypothetical protein
MANHEQQTTNDVFKIIVFGCSVKRSPAFSLASKCSRGGDHREIRTKNRDSSFCTETVQSGKNVLDNSRSRNRGTILAQYRACGAAHRCRQTSAKLLNGICLWHTPFAYSFCNLELQGVAAYSHAQAESAFFGPKRASKK